MHSSQDASDIVADREREGAPQLADGDAPPMRNVAVPGGGTMGVQLPPDVAAGQSMQFTVSAVQPMAVQEQEVSVAVPAGAKPGHNMRVAVPCGSRSKA